MFNHMWATFRHGLLIVAASLLYFMSGIIGLSFANISQQGGYSIKYLSFISSLIYSIHNTNASPNQSEIITNGDLNYAPNTVLSSLFKMLTEIMYYWLMVVLLTGAFLPVFAKEFQYKCIRVKEGSMNQKDYLKKK